MIGMLASVTGLFLGLGLAKGLFKLFDAVGFTLPNSGIVFGTSTIVIALVAGHPRHAGREPAAGAPRDARAADRRGARGRDAAGVALRALPDARLRGADRCSASPRSSTGSSGRTSATTGVLLYMGLGALLIFFGVAMLSVRFIRPLVWALGWPATRIGGAAGVLARDNARRNPQRTASTAAALMIGLALVTLVAVLAAGITSTFRGAVNKIWKNADYAITAQNNFSPIPTAAADARRKEPDVEAVGNVRTGDAGAFGKTSSRRRSTRRRATMFNLDWMPGSDADDRDARRRRRLRRQGLREEAPPARRLADPADVRGRHSSKTFTLQGIFDPPPGGSPFGTVTISQATWDANNENPHNLYSFVRMRGGESHANLDSAEKHRSRAFPNAKVQTRQQFIDNQISGLNSVLNILYVLLALSVIVSLFGIVNTLVLTVFERTREIGMLRAIGMTRRQVRRMIRHESVITALIGGVARDRARHRARRAARRPGRLHPVLAAGRLADRLRGRDDHRRHPRRDLPGAPGGAAERARGAPVRMTRGRARCAAAAARRRRRARGGRPRRDAAARPGARRAALARRADARTSPPRRSWSTSGARTCLVHAREARPAAAARRAHRAERRLARGRGAARGARGDGARASSCTRPRRGRSTSTSTRSPSGRASPRTSTSTCATSLVGSGEPCAGAAWYPLGEAGDESVAPPRREGRSALGSPACG